VQSHRYLDPKTGVLRNLLGITDADELERVARRISIARLVELETSPIAGSFDLDHLCRIHRHLFGDLYPWAGELRDVDISKDGHVWFCRAAIIASHATTVFRDLARAKFLVGLDRENFLTGLSTHLVEVNALHPFFDGNGRAQRAFFSQLARNAGFEIAWTDNKVANDAASAAGMLGDIEQMRMLLDPGVRELA